MRRRTHSAALAAALAAAMMSVLSPAALAAPSTSPAFYGREVFKIVTVRLGERRPAAVAWGAFHAKGVFLRRLGTFDFPKGRITVTRRVTSTVVHGPDLATCRFTIRQHGTFAVVRGTGRYRRLRESGTFNATVRGRYNQTGTNRCGFTLVSYHVVTYETGFAR